jgi:repressor LexA
VSEKDKYIWVRVQGDSMFPKIEDGDKILIRLQDSVDSGQVGIVLIDGEEAVVKKINYDTDYIELISFNPYYPPRRFEGSDVQRIRVVGLVREVNKELQ